MKPTHVVADEVDLGPKQRAEAVEQADRAIKDRAAFEGNRAERRAREREDRRAIKAAAITAIGRTL